MVAHNYIFVIYLIMVAYNHNKHLYLTDENVNQQNFRKKRGKIVIKEKIKIHNTA